MIPSCSAQNEGFKTGIYRKPDDCLLQSSTLAKTELILQGPMKTKMCIKMSVNSDKFMRKAMKVAVGAKGVISVAIEGEFKDELVVVGDGVDAACLVNALRMKVCRATLETLKEVKPNIIPPDDAQTQQDNDTDKVNNMEISGGDNGTKEIVASHCCLAQCPCICYDQPQHQMYEVIYDSYDPTECTII